MSKVINEYSYIREDIGEKLDVLLEGIKPQLEKMSEELDLNGEEIRQLYNWTAESISVEGIMKAMSWGIKHRKELREKGDLNP